MNIINILNIFKPDAAKSGYFLLAIIFIATYLLVRLIRKIPNGKPQYARNSISVFIFEIALCAGATMITAMKPGFFNPVWFEDMLLLDVIVVFVGGFAFFTRKIQRENLFLGIIATFLGTMTTICVCELALKNFDIVYIYENRIGKKNIRYFNADTDYMIHGSLPGPEERAKMNERGVTLGEAVKLRDFHIVPSPDKKEGEIRIVWLGDSMTEGAQVPEADRFYVKLNETVSQPNYSLAIGGTSTDFARVMVERYFDILDPDIVVLGFYPLNDYEEFGQQMAACNFGSLFTPEGDGFRYACGGDMKRSLFTNIFFQPENFLFNFSARYTLLGNLMIQVRKELYADIARKYYYIDSPFQPKLDISKLSKNINVKEMFLHNEKAVCSMVNEINKFVTSKEAVFGVVMIPYVLDDKKYIDPSGFYPPKIYGDAFLECMKDSDIPFFNLHGAFEEKQLDMNSENTVFFQDRHFNSYGHEKATEFLTPFIMELIEKRKTPYQQSRNLLRHAP